MSRRGVIEEYHPRLSLPPGATPITLLEGDTPLIEAPRLAHAIGLDGTLYLKNEGLNPTGSFKDRGMTVAITKAVCDGAQAVICASTGNTAASAAAYAARAGLPAYIVIPTGKVATGKMSQVLVHGAKVVEIDGNFDQALQLVTALADEHQLTIVNSVNPFRLEGQKTAAFEVCDVLGLAPDYHFLPVGNAGNITAYWMGYREYKDAGIIDGLPRMMGYQAAGAAPIVLGHPVDNPETVATAIRIGNPAGWATAVTARDESGGDINSVTDEEIMTAHGLLASLEGVFAEPASAAAVAGLQKAISANQLAPSSVIVCTLTGHGLKDAARAATVSAPSQAPVDIHAVREVLKL